MKWIATIARDPWSRAPPGAVACVECPAHRTTPGGDPAPCTRSIRGPSPTPMATASAIWRASGSTSTTSPGWASTPSGCRPSFAHRWPTSGTTWPTTATSTRCSATWPPSTALLAEAHDLGIRVIVDLVPNHTSDQHPWFVAARSSRDDPKRDWYVWRDGGGPEEPPNNWRGAFVEGGRAWTWDAATEQWYLHQFLPQQPDLNWDNPEVVEAIHGVMRFWLDRGVDGFRIDVVHCIGRDPAFPDDEPPWSEVPHCASNEHPSTHAHIRAMRRLADSYRRATGCSSARPPSPGRSGSRRTTATATSCTSPSTSAPPTRPGTRGHGGAAWIASTALLGPRGAWPTWVFSNHDFPRHRTRLRRQRGPRPGGGRDPPHPARHPVRLRRGGAGPGGRRGP